MKRFALLLAALLTLLAGCNTQTQPGFFQPELSAGESELLELVDGGQTFVWDFIPPEGAKYLRYEVGYYKDGVREAAVDKRSYAFELSTGKGRLLVDIAPKTNTQYRSSLGSVDFFDNPVASRWTVRLTDRRSGEGTSFFTGYDFANTYQNVMNYNAALYQTQGTAPVELEQTVVMFCFALSREQKDAPALVDLEQDARLLKEYPYAYVFQCKFTAD